VGITRKIKAGRVKTDYTEFVGEKGILFYNEENGTLRIGDGETAGGLPVNLLGDTDDIQLGNFLIDGSTFTTTELNANIGIFPNGSGVVEIGGGFEVKSSADSTATTTFKIDSEGKVFLLVPNEDSVAGGIEIVGNTSGSALNTGNTGVLVHVTGQQGVPTRLYADGVNTYPVYIGRRYNGFPEAPTSVLSGDIITRYGSNAYDGTGFAPLGVGNISIVATQNHTPSAKGSKIEFYTIPDNSTTLSLGASINGNGLVATNLTTTGRANITNTNITSAVALLTVSANQQGLTKTPVLTGTIAQFTGKDNQQGFLVQDNYGLVGGISPGGQYVFRTGRGTNASPSAVQTNDILGEVVAAGWGTTGYSGVSSAGIRFIANQNFTDTERGGKIALRVVPNGSNSAIDALTITPTAVNLADGSTMTGWVNLPAGTVATAPLQFAAGPLPTIEIPGAQTYDGVAFYAVPSGLEIGIIPTQQMYVLNASRNLTPNTTNAQSIFGKIVSLTANTRYYYEINLRIRKEGPQAAVIQYGILAANGASITSHRYWAISSSTATENGVSSASQMSSNITTNFATPVSISAAMPTDNPAFAQVRISGFIVMNAAGTVDFQIAFNPAPNQALSIQPNSSIKIYPVGLAGSDINIGTWA